MVQDRLTTGRAPAAAMVVDPPEPPLRTQRQVPDETAVPHVERF